MTSKTPFLESYLEQFGDEPIVNDDINKMIKDNECRVIPYISIKDMKDIDLSKYDYVVLFDNQLYDLSINNKNLYCELLKKGKLLYFGKYNPIFDEIFYNNIIQGLEIIITNKMCLTMSNITKYVSVKKHHGKYEKNISKYLNYFTSSIKVIDVFSQTIIFFECNNLPNKTQILNINYGLKPKNKIKLPKNIILITDQFDNPIDYKTIQIFLQIKTKKTLIKIAKNEVGFSIETDTIMMNVFSIMKDKNHFVLMDGLVASYEETINFECVTGEKITNNDINYIQNTNIREVIKDTTLEKHIWDILSDSFISFNIDDHYTYYFELFISTKKIYSSTKINDLMSSSKNISEYIDRIKANLKNEFHVERDLANYNYNYR
jgi:hypothetical protein